MTQHWLSISFEELEHGQRSYQANELNAGATALLGAKRGGRRGGRSNPGAAGTMSTK